jgi:hypothetical protein
MEDIVCLVGSSRFKDTFHRIGAELEKKGILVLMMSFFQHADNVSITPEEREILYRVDCARIDISKRVMVINEKRPYCLECRSPCQLEWDLSACCAAEAEMIPYIGSDTRREIEYAKKTGKPISYLHPEKDV